MNKKIIGALLLACFSVVAVHAQYARTVLTQTEVQAISQSAQEANQTQMEQIKLRDEAEQQKREKMHKLIDGWHNFVLLNGAFSNIPDYTFGLTYARVSKVGFYVNAMTNFNYHFPVEYQCEWYGRVDDNNYTPFYTGKKEYTHISTSAGVVACLGIPLYAYAGLGYTYHGRFYETTDGKWIKYASEDHFANAEIGLIGQYKGFSLSLGVICAFDEIGHSYWHAKVGVGYCFKDKKK